MSDTPLLVAALGIAPDVSAAPTMDAALVRLVDRLASVLETGCAVFRREGVSWVVEAGGPGADWTTPEDAPRGTCLIPLGAVGGVERRLAVGGGGETPTWVEALGDVLRDALALVCLRTELELRRRLEKGCHRFSCKLLLAKPGETLHQLIVSRMAQAVGAQTGALALHLPAENALKIVATHGYPSVLVDHVRVRPGDGVLGRVFATRRLESSHVPPSRPNPMRQRRYRADSYVAVPLVTGDGVLGVISVTERSGSGRFTPADVAVLRAYAIPAAMALAREALRERTHDLAHLATVDALTAISNRRHFDERLAQEIQRARREHGDLALLMIDIDDFKALNDARGHQTGDRVLQQVADILRRSVRTFDVCARYGGEEFAILMPGANASTAFRIAERIRRHTESHLSDGWRHTANAGPTLSIGVSTASPDMTGDLLVATADAALLRAKAEGKNVVKLYTAQAERRAAG